jgi:hypothetical protein
MNNIRDILAINLKRVEERIVAACERADRRRETVKLVAVTKSASVEVAAQLIELGVCDLAESRPQELWRKASLLPKNVRWHLIGHLQRNKIERTLPLVHLIHSVDSVRLLEALEKERPVEVLLEVNCSGEASKQGFGPADVNAINDVLNPLRQVNVIGLMTMAAYEEDPQQCRPAFRLLHTLRDQLGLRELSMGMSNDFEVAIEEGATMIRLGTVLFEGLP